VRICVVTHYMPPHRGGVERVAEAITAGYAKAGHIVTWVAASDGARGADGPPEIDRVLLPASNFLERRFGMPYPLPAPWALGPLHAAVTAADIVHLHDCLYLPNVLADEIARRRKIPSLVTQHVAMGSFSSVVNPPLRLAYRTVGRSVLRRAGRVVFISEHVRQWFSDNVDASLRTEIIPNGVDTNTFRVADSARRQSARRHLGLPLDVPVVLFVGRLVPQKNIGVLAAALSLVRVPWHALVIGDGPERPQIEGLGRRLTHRTDVPPQEMPEVYAAADIFVLPSPREGLPISLLEALAAGLPAVLCDDQAFASLVTAGASIVPPRAADVAAAVEKLLADPIERARRGDAARRWAGAHASDATVIPRYLALINEIVA